MGTILTSGTEYSFRERNLLCRIVFSISLISLVYSFYAFTLVHQLQEPVLRYPYVDLTYWLLNWLQLPEVISGHFVVACFFDGALVTCCLLAILYPANRIAIGIYTVLFFIYFILFNTYGAHHTTHKAGMLLMPLPFLASSERNFNYLWQSLRYFLLFSFSCAFTWKLFRLGWVHPDQGWLIMRKNIVAYLYYNPGTSMASMYRWLLAHPWVANALYIAGFILEGLFIVGFFTRKYDHYLLIMAILLIAGFWLVAEANFTELLILGLTLINFRKLFLRYGVYGAATSN